MSEDAKIVRRKNMRGGSPTIAGTRITVTDIVRRYRMYLPLITAGFDGPPNVDRGFIIPLDAVVGEIRAHLPHLSKAQIEAGLRYWREHEIEVATELLEEDAAALELRREYSRSL